MKQRSLAHNDPFAVCNDVPFSRWCYMHCYDDLSFLSVSLLVRDPYTPWSPLSKPALSYNESTVRFHPPGIRYMCFHSQSKLTDHNEWLPSCRISYGQRDTGEYGTVETIVFTSFLAVFSVVNILGRFVWSVSVVTTARHFGSFFIAEIRYFSILHSVDCSWGPCYSFIPSFIVTAYPIS